MKTLIQHLLQLSRVGRGTDFETVETDEVISCALDTLSHRIAEKHAVVNVQDGLPRVLGDAVQLEQVFQNLVGNALKFVPSGRVPRVRISAERNGRFATFHVADNGIGVKKEYQERIFGIFKRLHTQKEYEGAGIGLALCAKIVRRHGGEIRIESEHDRGCTFHLTLPLADAPQEDPGRLRDVVEENTGEPQPVAAAAELHEVDDEFAGEDATF